MDVRVNGPMGDAVARRLERMELTFRERNAVYGNNFFMVGDVLKALFPDGPPVLETAQDYARYDLLTMIVGKLTRYAKSYSAGGHEDSLEDLGVYSAILAQFDAEITAPRFEPAPAPAPEPNSADTKKLSSEEIDRIASKIRPPAYKTGYAPALAITDDVADSDPF